jgi:hypothetical protein
MYAAKVCSCLLLVSAVLPVAGCITNLFPDCSPVGLQIGPDSAAVDHAAAPPGNSQTFSATFRFSGDPGCVAAQTAALVDSTWTASDPSVHLSATPGSQVTATCTATLNSPVTISATQLSGEQFTGHATLTCD